MVAANDSGLLVGQLGSQVILWRAGRATILSERGGQVHAMNSTGTSTGSKPVPPEGTDEYRATVWSSTGVATDIAPAGAQYSTGHAITDDGTVVLDYSTFAGVSRWALWRAGALTPLGLTGNARFGAINERRQVAATDYRDGTWTATRCKADGSCAALPQLPGTLSSWAYDINDSGVVVGSAEVRTGTTTESVAVVWRGGTVTALPGLSGPAGQRCSRAERINDTGLVVGRSGTSGDEAVVWKDGAVVRIAPGKPLQSFDQGIAGINDAGEVVVNLRQDRSATDRTLRGFLWKAGTLRTVSPSFPLPSVEIAGITPGGLIHGSSFLSLTFSGGAVYDSRATTWRFDR